LWGTKYLKEKSMNQRTKILAFLFIFLTLSSCEHKTDSCTACGVNNPIENIPWLKSLIDNITVSNYKILSEVDLIEYESKELILITWTLNGIYDIPTGEIYDCAGKLLYSCGGNQPIDSCSIILNESRILGKIWNQ